MSITATSGVVSNIDYQSLITQLVNVRKYSINQLESEKSALKSAQTAYSNLSTKIKSLITAADALKSGSAFSIFKTTTSESSYFTATAGSTSAAGSYEVTVNSLAKAHRIAADGVATDTIVCAIERPSVGWIFNIAGLIGAFDSICPTGSHRACGAKREIVAGVLGVYGSILLFLFKSFTVQHTGSMAYGTFHPFGGACHGGRRGVFP